MAPQEQSFRQPQSHYSGFRVQTPEYCAPYIAPRHASLPSWLLPSQQHETVYCGPKPSILAFSKGHPREFARLKVALDNLLPEDAKERFKYTSSTLHSRLQILVDHLKYEEALLIVDFYSSSLQPYTDTMNSLTEHYGQPHQLALRKIANLMEAQSIAHS